MTSEPPLARYGRQMLFRPIGEAGQRRIAQARVTLVGCGALGSVLASTLVRAGVGQLRVVDRDFLELDNLQRQVLFDEQDVADNLPKAEAAARKLRRINSAVTVEPVVADFNPTNAELLCTDATLLLDGTDNLETRYLINDMAVKLRRPWVYCACVAAEGRVLTILPDETPCFRCVWPDPPAPGSLPTCDTVGVLGPIVNIVAGFAAAEALKILSGNGAAVNRKLMTIDAWSGRVQAVDVSAARRADDCPCCGQRRFEFLSGRRSSLTTALCGRQAVQVLPPPGARVSFREIAGRLPPDIPRIQSDFLLRFTAPPYTVTLFADGRAIVQGTADAGVAKAVYARYVGA